MRAITAGSIHEAVAGAYAAAGGLECAALDLALSTSALSRANDPNDEARPGGLGVNHLHRLATAVPLAAVPIAEHFARLAGGKFTQETNAPKSCLADIAVGFAEALKIHTDAHSDNSDDPSKLTPPEARSEYDVLKRVEKLIQAQLRYTEGFL